MPKIYQVDAFTTVKFKGNPAAVVLLQQPGDAHWMQKVAAEMNLSETAFVTPAATGFDLRWFTPVAEVDLCGHATLAAAHILYEYNILAKNKVARFQTKSGILTVHQKDDLLEMDFPAEPASEIPPIPVLTRALGIDPVITAQNRMDILVQVQSADSVINLKPNYEELAQIPVRGVIVTSISNDTAYDFISRFFAPRYGVNEDPVTGSAHCCLAPYWAEKLEKNSLIGFQAGQRGGFVYMSNKRNRVELAGHAVTIFAGQLI